MRTFNLALVPCLCVHRYSPERLEEIFSEYGEVTSIYFPVDLKSRKPRGFAFVRYGHQGTAELAVKGLNDTNLGVGRNIQLSIVSSKTYMSQDESDTLHVARYS
jgi:RNA recognition motif-containing protein